MLTGQRDLKIAQRAVNDGEVYRFFVKPCNAFDLAFAIRSALKELDLSASRAPSTSNGDLLGASQLSSREREVANHLLEGKRSQEIGKALYISPHTVRNHTRSIFRKLGIHSQIELIRKLR